MLDEFLLGLLYASPIAYFCGLLVFALVPVWPEKWGKFMYKWPILVLSCILWPLFGLVLLAYRVVSREDKSV